MMKKLLTLLMLMLPPATVSGAPEIIQSPLDPRAYRALELDNGLKVLLVSDPATDRSAASLDVHIGSGSDPDEWQGLAHFLEHMLFLGTQKYPEAGEYKKFIDDHGGNNNAYTSFSHTNYYFDISADHLRPALDRFSRFFIDPTFDATFVNRERAVVHSEYQARRKDEGRRSWSARRRLIDPRHPASRFVVGSEHTLRDRDGISVRQKLIEFYRRHYSADLMTLTVVGKESLDRLDEWVAELFVEVPDRDADAELFTQPYLNPQLHGSRLNVAPQKDELRASFMFPIAGIESFYRSKPLGYIANLVGHEGEGSLLALLESLGWAEGLSAGAGYTDKAQGVFEVSVRLTESGLEHLDEIGSLLFQYIELIRTEGVESWRYDEQRKLAAIAFRFAEKPGAGATARRLAAGLHRYPLADVLRGPYMMEDYRPELITDLLARLMPDNVFLQVLAKGVETSDKTPFYEVDYGIAPIPPATIARWSRAGSKDGQDQRLTLPAANRFIPERLHARALASNEASPDAAVPERLDEHPGMVVWYRGDPQFGTPRAAFYFSIKSPLAGGSARSLVLDELFVRMVNRQLDTATYAARLAGLGYELYRHSRGISVRISGYEDKQPAMLETLLEALLETKFDAAQLTLVKDELRREWKNVSLETPSNQVVHELYRLLLHPYWSEAERLAVLDEMGVDDLKDHAAELFEKIHITALSHGDVTRARAVSMSEMLRTAFANSEFIDEVERNRVRMLDDHGAYLRSLDVDHDDSALAIYFQGGGKSTLERAKMLLLARLAESPFFFNLRTTHRVGYLVHATPLNILEVPGLLFSVQSPTHNPAQIKQLIDEFLESFGEMLEQMDAGEFARVKQGLTDRILVLDKKLVDRTNRYWREIDRRELTFDTRRHIAEEIAGLNQNDILRYFRQVTKTQLRKLMVQSPGRRPQAAGGAIDDSHDDSQYTPVGDAVQFRKSAHSFFPAYR